MNHPVSLPRLALPTLSEEKLSFEKVHIGCVGDLMLDRYMVGEVGKISPEAPVPVFRLTEETLALGGVGNVAANGASYEATVSLWGRVGEDKGGEEILSLLKESSKIQSFLWKSSSLPTIEKTRVVSQGQHLLRMDQERVERLSPSEEKTIQDHIRSVLPSLKAVVLSDYHKGFLTPSLCQAIIQDAKKLSIPVLIDPKGTDFSFYKGATLITPNRQELALALGTPLLTLEEVVEGAQKMREDLQLEAIIVTLGPEGLLFVPREGEVQRTPTQAREVFDMVGAGDTVIATLAVALGAGISLPEAVYLANLAAGLVVEKKGTSVITREELIYGLGASRSFFSSPHPKLVSLSQGIHKVEHWNHQGLVVGFTNGCFDLLHPGHLKLLQEARLACDRLVVGINSDASVKRLKGMSRPIQDEMMRAHILACQPSVDLVVLFSEDTPESMIHALKPQVLVKGSDYKMNQVVGADFVQGQGGQVLLVDLLPNHSTTRLLQSLAS
jgi:D-beta-D-heptose 7-phosphate kinase/D-beta-D-heptose 1-phosphate adenosyltransferase